MAKKPETTGGENLLSEWVETGYTSDAVSMYGTSVAVLKQILKSGKLPGMPAEKRTLDYQKELVKGGKHLYYSLGIPENLKAVRPELVEEMIDKLYPETFTIQSFIGSKIAYTINLPGNLQKRKRKGLPPDLKTPYVRDKGRFYAKMNAMMAKFRELTGISTDVDTVLAVTINCWPEEFAEYEKTAERSLGNPYKEIISPAEKRKIQSLVTKVKKMPGIKPSWLKDKGVVLYFDKSALTKGDVQLGEEDEEEILITTKEPLTTSVISGIEVLSARERKELGI